MINNQTPQKEKTQWTFIRKVGVRTLLFFVLFNVLFAVFNLGEAIGNLSAYNSLYPGRNRLPFGENSRESYNLSLFDINALVRSHQLMGVAEKPTDEFRVIVLGDSSIWGTLLRPEETFTGMLNQVQLRTNDGKNVRFYNLGYPSMSVTKDLLLLDVVKDFDPDLILWGVTLESLVMETQLAVPLVSNNMNDLGTFSMEFVNEVRKAESPDFFGNTIFGQRRAIADLIRLKVYGFMWAATGIDQSYPENYPEAMRDFEENSAYRNYQESNFNNEAIAFEVLEAGVTIAGEVPVVFFNEPILISEGKNSDIRYNFLYPRWVYDAYRGMMNEYFEATNLFYFDFWDAVPQQEFTNSAVHLTPIGEELFVQTFITDALLAIIK